MLCTVVAVPTWTESFEIVFLSAFLCHFFYWNSVFLQVLDFLIMIYGRTGCATKQTNVGCKQLEPCCAPCSVVHQQVGPRHHGYPTRPALHKRLVDASVAGGGCIDINGCGTIVDTYECLTTGGSCGGSTFPNLMWTYSASTGALTSALDGLVLTAAANGTLFALPVAGNDPGQSWNYNMTSGQISLRSGAGCVSIPPQKRYARICGRVQSLSGFDGSLTAYCLEIQHDGAWALMAHPNPAPLASGTIASFQSTDAHIFNLVFAGPLVQASVDTKVLAQVSDDSIAAGNVLLGGGWHSIDLDDVVVTAA